MSVMWVLLFPSRVTFPNPDSAQEWKTNPAFTRPAWGGSWNQDFLKAWDVFSHTCAVPSAAKPAGCPWHPAMWGFSKKCPRIRNLWLYLTPWWCWSVVPGTRSRPWQVMFIEVVTRWERDQNFLLEPHTIKSCLIKPLWSMYNLK